MTTINSTNNPISKLSYSSKTPTKSKRDSALSTIKPSTNTHKNEKVAHSSASKINQPTDTQSKTDLNKVDTSSAKKNSNIKSSQPGKKPLKNYAFTVVDSKKEFPSKGQAKESVFVKTGKKGSFWINIYDNKGKKSKYENSSFPTAVSNNLSQLLSSKSKKDHRSALKIIENIQQLGRPIGTRNRPPSHEQYNTNLYFNNSKSYEKLIKKEDNLSPVLVKHSRKVNRSLSKKVLLTPLNPHPKKGLKSDSAFLKHALKGID